MAGCESSSHAAVVTVAPLNFCLHHHLRGQSCASLMLRGISRRASHQMIIDKKYCKAVPITGNIRLSVRSPIAPVQQVLQSLGQPKYCCPPAPSGSTCTLANDSYSAPTFRPCWCYFLQFQFLHRFDTTCSLFFRYLDDKFSSRVTGSTAFVATRIQACACTCPFISSRRNC